jgi:uncharacterized repeat protein (TIGR01451 family)
VLHEQIIQNNFKTLKMKKQLIPLLLSLFLCFPAFIKACDDYIVLRLEKIDNGDGTVSVKMYADGFIDVQGFQFSLIYSPDYSYLNHEFATLNIPFNNTVPGVFSAVFLSPGNVSLTVSNIIPILTLNLRKNGLENLSIKIANDNSFNTIKPEIIDKNSKSLCIISGDFVKPNLGQVIKGNVFLDLNADCADDADKRTVSDWSVNVQGPSKNYVQKVQANGNFLIVALEVGTYTITSIPSSNSWDNCIAAKSFTFDSLNTSAAPAICDFYAQPKILNCPQGEVSINNFLLRRCFDNNTYFVGYNNTGTEAISNAKIEVQLDDKFILKSCSYPNFTITVDNKLIADLGTLDIMEYGNFTFTVEVDCDKALLGETHCVEAKILPYKDCNLFPYNGPKLDLKASCNDNKIKFTLTNIGQQAMTESIDYIVIEDDVMNIKKPVLLQALESHEYTIEATSSTYRMIIPQVKEYKNQTFLTKAIEACGNNPNLGFFTNFQESDEELHIDILCIENIGSYDPNDISVTPKGYGSSRYILPNTELEYLIRFQNTGTDTAFTVVVKDTLDQSFDLSSFELKHHSHPCVVTIDQNILTFRFDKIMLLDSFKNEPESHGYIAYTISPLKDLDNSAVLNQAHIYFDYNKPINTNITDQYLSSWFLTETIEAPFEQLQISIYPNPTSKFIHFKNNASESVLINLYDINGKKLSSFEMGNEVFSYDVSNKKGIYISESIFKNGKKEMVKIIVD